MTSPSFIDHVLELLGSDARASRMFGGHGIYLGDLFIGIVAGDVLYLKADRDGAAAFAAAGSQPFSYRRRGRETTLGFWSAPDAALESPQAMREWARLAAAAALRARAKKTGRTLRPAATLDKR